MDAQVRANSAVNILIMTMVVLGGLVALYYLYNFLYGVAGVKSNVILEKDTLANKTPAGYPEPPPIYEGGDYTITMWLYVNSYNVNRNRRKHILELAGENFSSLLVGLGAFKPTLIVRTHSREPDNAYAGVDVYGNSAECSTPSNVTPNSADANRPESSLTKADVQALFKPLAMDDALLDSSPVCDMPEIDMQRWVHVAIVISGRVIDVYVDGKLGRSCVTKSYYKVDPTGVKLKLLDRAGADGEAGFDGHIANVTAANTALSPSDIYRMYSNGPFGNSANVISWTTSWFKG